jgi:phospholipase C
MLGQTLPNRRYWFSGTSSGQVNDDNSAELVFAQNGTIFDRLDSASVDWRVYYSTNSFPTPFYFPNFRDNPLQVARCMSQQQFFSDAAAGRLPPVCYVEANGSYQSEENPQDLAYGESFLHDVAQACMHSPQWSKLALVVNYDEHGGYYDHVAPPAAVPPDDIPPDLTLSAKGTYPARFDRYGFRVPFIVVSPWGQPDYVSHQVMDHTSVLAFIEHKWNLPPMTRRDAAAWPMLDLFDTSRRRLAAIDLPPPPSIDQTAATCQAHGKNPPTPQSSPVPTP